jgi:hypothetical protein
MKGRLHNTKDGWVVKFEYIDDQYSSYMEFISIELPVISEQQSLYMFAELSDDWKNKCEGMEVEFEYLPNNKNTKFLLSGFAKIKVDECEPIISDDFQIGPDGAYEHSDRNISFQSILWKVSEQLQNVQYDNGDISDLGNEIGISVGKGVENMTENEISIFISGIRHGISLTNGTH